MKSKYRICCPDCLWELFEVREDLRVYCAKCKCEINLTKEPEKKDTIH